MLKKLRKSSSRVTLVLIGVAALSGCGKEQKRDVYASKEDCLADWGNKPEDCTPATEARHRGSGFFYGPLIMGNMLGRGASSWSNNTGSSRAIGSTSAGSSGAGSSTRGGFGSSGRSSVG